MRRRDNFGVHIVSDLYGCSPEKLMKTEEIEKAIETAIQESHLTKITSHFHQFKPYGFTGFVLLSESHLAVHTWPEYNFAAVTFETCGRHMNHEKAWAYLIRFFRSKDPKISHQKRGFMEAANTEFAYKQEVG